MQTLTDQQIRTLLALTRAEARRIRDGETIVDDTAGETEYLAELADALHAMRT